jgi:uncharacterized protein (DUF1697 family)
MPGSGGRAGSPVRYAALLRGVNVGGNAKIAMADLRALLEGLDFGSVKTLLQSGNAVFDVPSAGAGASALATTIEQALTDSLGLKTRVVLVTHQQLAAVIKANPFPSAEDEPSKHLVQFLFAPLTEAERARIASFDAPAFEPEEFRVGDEVIYFRFPGGIGRSALAVAFGKHVTAKLAMTGRNWNTVRKLHDLTAV